MVCSDRLGFLTMFIVPWMRAILRAMLDGDSVEPKSPPPGIYGSSKKTARTVKNNGSAGHDVRAPSLQTEIRGSRLPSCIEQFSTRSLNTSVPAAVLP